MRKSQADRVFHVLLIIVAITLIITGCKKSHIQVYHLQNGMKIIHLKNDKDVIAVDVFLKGGVSLITPEKAGLEPFLLDVMSKGSTSYPREKLEETIDNYHFSINSSAIFDHSVYRLKTISANFRPAIQVFIDTFLHPSFDEAAIEEVRQQKLSELNQTMQDPFNAMVEKANRVCFEGHPYASSPDGTVESVKNMQISDLKTFYKQNWIADRMVVICVGNVSKEVLLPALESSLGKLPVGNYKPENVPPLDTIIKNDFYPVESPGLTNYHMRSNFPSVKATHPDFVARELETNRSASLRLHPLSASRINNIPPFRRIRKHSLSPCCISGQCLIEAILYTTSNVAAWYGNESADPWMQQETGGS